MSALTPQYDVRNLATAPEIRETETYLKSFAQQNNRTENSVLWILDNYIDRD